jgi:hypothetical protein
MNNIMAAFFACTKWSAACKFACGIRKVHETLILFSNNTERIKIKNLG